MLKYAQKAAEYASRIQKSLELSVEGSERHPSQESAMGDVDLGVDAPLAADEPTDAAAEPTNNTAEPTDTMAEQTNTTAESTDATAAEPEPGARDLVIWRTNRNFDKTNEPMNFDDTDEPMDVDDPNEPVNVDEIISGDAEPEVSHILSNDKAGTSYLVYGLIGQGGTGRVVKAKTPSGLAVAIKSISKWQKMRHAGMRKVLRREMEVYRLTAWVRILNLKERGRVTENLYLMQLCESWEADKYINYVMVCLFDPSATDHWAHAWYAVATASRNSV